MSFLRDFLTILLQYFNQGISLNLCVMHGWKALDVSIKLSGLKDFLVISESLLMKPVPPNASYSVFLLICFASINKDYVVQF